MTSINDIAREAGVSNATVSRVLADKPHVTPEVRQRVLQVARDMGYHPDTTARRLRQHSQSRVLGLVVSSVQNPHWGAVASGIDKVAYEHGMNVILCNKEHESERELFYINLMHSERAAGLIINPTQPETGNRLETLRAAGTAIVLLGGKLENYTFDSVAVDNWHGAYAATQHLIRRGFRRIGIVAGDLLVNTARDRLRGYRDAMTEAGFAVTDDLIARGEYNEELAHQGALRLLQLDPPVQAIFSCNNVMTFGVLQAARDLGRCIPDDVALVGFDDPAWAQFVDPPLTSVAQPSYQIGLEAARVLLERIQRPDAPPQNLILPSTLMVRKSCGSP